MLETKNVGEGQNSSLLQGMGQNRSVLGGHKNKRSTPYISLRALEATLTFLAPLSRPQLGRLFQPPLRQQRFDDKAMWLDDLRPAFGDEKFFYEDELARLSKDSDVSSGQAHPLTNGGSQGKSDAFEAGRALNGAGGIGRGICLAGGTGDMRYRNDVIPPAPVGRQDQ